MRGSYGLTGPRPRRELPPHPRLVHAGPAQIEALEARGQGIAPAAWTLIGDELRQAGFTALVTKIEAANAPSRRAAEEVGVTPVAVMDHRRVALRRRTAVRALGAGLGAELAARLKVLP